MATTGKDLKLKRVAADVQAKQIAFEMGVSAAIVSRVENSRLVTDEMAARYLTALDMCITKSNPEAAA
jgi:hypothetical protein